MKNEIYARVNSKEQTGTVEEQLNEIMKSEEGRKAVFDLFSKQYSIDTSKKVKNAYVRKREKLQKEIEQRPNIKVGYARVSTKSQQKSLDEQIADLEASKVEQMYVDNNKNKNNMKKMLNNLKQGDEIIVTQLDRLTKDINLYNEILDRGIKVTVIDEENKTHDEIGNSKLLQETSHKINEIEREEEKKLLEEQED